MNRRMKSHRLRDAIDITNQLVAECRDDILKELRTPGWFRHWLGIVLAAVVALSLICPVAIAVTLVVMYVGFVGAVYLDGSGD